MKNINIMIIAGVFFLFLLSSFSLALGVPHQFYGEVIANGNPAPDNIEITAKIGSDTVAATFTKDGKYGFNPYIFYIQDPNDNRDGKTIDFFIKDVKATSYTFSNGMSTNLVLSADNVDLPTPPSNGGSGGGGGGGGSKTTTTTTETTNADCTPNWYCSVWLDCVNTIQKRVCSDLNNCNTDEGKPIEQQDCVSEELKDIVEDTQPGFFSRLSNLITGAAVGNASSNTTIGIGILILIIIVALILYFGYFRKRK